MSPFILFAAEHVKRDARVPSYPYERGNPLDASVDPDTLVRTAVTFE
jgi:hypothetical protein